MRIVISSGKGVAIDMLKIVHHPLYDAVTVADTHRFPMRKYTLLPVELMKAGIAYPNSFYEPELASREQLVAAHCADYVDAVLTGGLDRQAQRKLGFEWTIDVANRARASSAGTLMAAKLALKHGVAANTAGGSHHASYDFGAGFCVFNDVAVASSNLLRENVVQRILIIDLDVHHGDGTARIFADEERVFTFSMHCEDNWPREKPASSLDIGLPRGVGDLEYIENLRSALDRVFSKIEPDIVFYNAGVDPHEEDRLGLLNLSDEGLQDRDRIVAERCFGHGYPIVGVLGGGYSKDPFEVVHRHVGMFRALRDVCV